MQVRIPLATLAKAHKVSNCLGVVRVPIAQMVERPLREQEVVGSIPGCAIPKAIKMVSVATLLGAQHYKASTGSSHSLLTLHTKKTNTKKINPQHLVRFVSFQGHN